jgi:hypothetical protein
MGTKTQKLSNIVDQIVEWQAVVTADGSTGLTTVAGRGYFIDTTSGAITVTLPVSPKAGDIVQLKDYARTWGTNNVTLASTLLDGATTTFTFSTNGKTVTLVYMDGTKGWSLVNEDTSSDLDPPPAFVTATGGTVTESGDYKIHTFTGDGCFVVSQIGNSPVNPLGGPSNVDYLVVAGGAGGGGAEGGGGGGAGGYRESSGAASGAYSRSPLGACVSALPISVQGYPITVGGGGSLGPSNSGSGLRGGCGSVSTFSTITSAGGGGGGGGNPSTPIQPGNNGGSGGGGGEARAGGTGSGGTGNTPPTSPAQGTNGGAGNPAGENPAGAGGGGGSTAAGQAGPPNAGGAGGAGATTSINGTPTARAGGGGGGVYGPACIGAGGSGGGGNGGRAVPCSGAVAGTTNTGGGGGGAAKSTANGAAGGSGIVIIRYKFQ